MLSKDQIADLILEEAKNLDSDNPIVVLEAEEKIDTLTDQLEGMIECDMGQKKTKKNDWN